MDIAVASAHRSETRAHVGAGAIQQRFPESQTARLVANERGEDVALAQRHARGGAERFLPLAEKNAAGDFSAPIERGDFLLPDAGE